MLNETKTDNVTFCLINGQGVNERMKFYFSKKGLMRFISHLDLMRLFARAARRAGLPLFISQGFSPHPKIRLKRAIKLGEEREREEGEIVLSEQIGKEEFCQRLNRHLPEGVTVSE